MPRTASPPSWAVCANLWGPCRPVWPQPGLAMEGQLTKTIYALALVTLAMVAAVPAQAQTFQPPGLWDPRPLDAPVRPPASVGAAIAAADARVNARASNQNSRQAGAGPGQDPVQETCSLSIGSVELPSRGTASNQTIVASADVRGTIIQICR